MKTRGWLWIAVAYLLVSGAKAAKSEFREFTGKNGKKLYAKLLKYDPSTKKVRVRCKRGFKTIPLDLFSDKDRRYILEWAEENAFKQIGVKFVKRKKEEKDRLVDNGFDETHYFLHWFELTFDNRTKYDFHEVEVEYVIFYTQEDLPESGAETEVEKKEGTQYEEVDVNIPKRSKITIKTEPISLFSYYNEANCHSYRNMDGHIVGIMVKLNLMLPSGRMVSKVFRYPSGLEKEWTTETVDVQRH